MAKALSRPQRELLVFVRDAKYGEGYFRSNYLRTAESLVRLGLFEPRGYGARCYGLTAAGRARADGLAPLRSESPPRARA